MAKLDQKLSLNLTLPLKTNLFVLASTLGGGPSKKIMSFARTSLGVTPEQEADWYAKARWGALARALLARYASSGRVKQVHELVEPFDWSPVTDEMAAGKGVILATAHLGLIPPLLAAVYRSSNLPALVLTPSDSVKRYTSDYLDVREDKNRRTALVQAFTHLRDGKVLFGAADGRWGAQYLTMPFLGQEVRMYKGFGELAHMANSTSFWLIPRWSGIDRIQLELRLIQPENGLDKDAWVEDWYRIYLSHMAAAMKASPEGLGFQGGLWRTSLGGLTWQ